MLRKGSNNLLEPLNEGCYEASSYVNSDGECDSSQDLLARPSTWHAVTEEDLEDEFIIIDVQGTPPRRNSNDEGDDHDMNNIKGEQTFEDDNLNHQFVPAVGLSFTRMAQMEVNESRKYKTLARAKALSGNQKLPEHSKEAFKEKSLASNIVSFLESSSKEKDKAPRMRNIVIDKNCKKCKGRGYVYLQESRIWPCVCMKVVKGEDTLVEKAKVKAKEGLSWLEKRIGMNSGQK